MAKKNNDTPFEDLEVNKTHRMPVIKPTDKTDTGPVEKVDDDKGPTGTHKMPPYRNEKDPD